MRKKVQCRGSMNEKTPGFCFSGFLIMMLVDYLELEV